MSVKIDPDEVTQVSLSDGAGWRYVKEGSFQVGTLEFVHAGGSLLANGAEGHLPLVVRFIESYDGAEITTPLASIVAFKTRRSDLPDTLPIDGQRQTESQEATVVADDESRS